MRFAHSRRALRCAGIAEAASSGWQRPAEECAVDRGHGADAERVTLAAPYGHALVERGPLGGLQLGRTQEVGDLARHVEGDRQFRAWVSWWPAVYSGMRSAMAVRIAPRLTSCSRARLAMVWPPRYAARTASVFSSLTARAAPALVALGLGSPQPVVGQFPLEVPMEFSGGREGLHHELHGGQQLSGARVACGEVQREERAVVDAQGEAALVQDVQHVEDVLRTSHKAEHLGDVHGVARPRVREQLAELRALERVEAAGGPGLLLERHRVLDPQPR
jgi:hypothetical protein